MLLIAVLIAGLFNAFFLVLSLRLLWRRYACCMYQGNLVAALHGDIALGVAFQSAHSMETAVIL